MTTLSVSNGGLKLIEVVVRLQTGSGMTGIECQSMCCGSFSVFLGVDRVLFSAVV
jgi:hypothetical protein